MTWADFYLVCFLVGFLLSAVSLFLSSSHIHLPHDGGGNGHGGLGHDAGHAHTGVQVSVFNFATGSAFLAWFGGTGYLLTRYSPVWLWLGVGLSVASGLAGAAIVFWFVAKVLLKKEQDLNPADYEMIGVLGRLTAPIREGGIGEILFTQEGARRAAGARSEDGRSIPRDAEVIVTRYENGIAYVRRFDDLVQ